MSRGIVAVTESEVTKVIEYIRLNLGASLSEANADADEYASLPQCVIDAVYSLGANYSSTRRTVEEWSKRNGWELCRGIGVREHTIEEFLGILEPYKNRWDEMADVVFDNSQRTSSTSGIRKAEAVFHFATAFRKFGVNTRADALKLDTEGDLRREIERIRGQASGLSFKYCLMNAGRTDIVKADRMVRRFGAKALGVRSVSAQFAERLVIEASSRLRAEFPGLTATALDNKIWKFESAQSASNRSQASSPCRRDMQVGDCGQPVQRI
jgi:hypothetical protein